MGMCGGGAPKLIYGCGRSPKALGFELEIKSKFNCRVGLAQLVRLLMVELTHLGSNPRFDMGVTFTANYSFSGRRRPHRQRDALGD
jgi:hypothetical protein